MMAMSANTLNTKPAANHANTGEPRYPLLNETIAHAIEQTMLTTSTNIQLAGSIKAIATNDFTG